MADHLTKEKRSWNMSRIKSGNTKPEIVVRSLLHSLGYRFRLHGKTSKKVYPKGILPGKPDVVLTRYRTVIFIHGCFWHRHKNCKYTTTPKTRTEWWLNKFSKTVERDKKKQTELESLGWKVVTIWECELKELDQLNDRLHSLSHYNNMFLVYSPQVDSRYQLPFRMFLCVYRDYNLRIF